jgi:hypothetical protein
MSSAALFVTAKKWKQLKCLSTDEWIKKIRYIDTIENYFSHKKIKSCRAPLAYACNPSYSGGRDQEDHCSKISPDKCL